MLSSTFLLHSGLPCCYIWHTHNIFVFHQTVVPRPGVLSRPTFSSVVDLGNPSEASTIIYKLTHWSLMKYSHICDSVMDSSVYVLIDGTRKFLFSINLFLSVSWQQNVWLSASCEMVNPSLCSDIAHGQCYGHLCQQAGFGLMNNWVRVICHQRLCDVLAITWTLNQLSVW